MEVCPTHVHAIKISHLNDHRQLKQRALNRHPRVFIKRSREDDTKTKGFLDWTALPYHPRNKQIQRFPHEPFSGCAQHNLVFVSPVQQHHEQNKMSAKRRVCKTLYEESLGQNSQWCEQPATDVRESKNLNRALCPLPGLSTRQEKPRAKLSPERFTRAQS